MRPLRATDASCSWTSPPRAWTRPTSTWPCVCCAAAPTPAVAYWLVLHDLNLAAAYADRVVLMAAARVVATGSPAEVLRPDLLERVFGIPMLVLPHPRLAHSLVIAEPQSDGA